MVINAFVGSMVGLERAILPLIAEQNFAIASRTVILSFVATFGIAKSVSNLVAGRLSDQVGRKKVLIAGWMVGIPVPLIILYAPSWAWIVAANVLLGINQGLAWSATVIMKIDLVGPRQRGLAMGLNESAGYVAVGITALVSGYIASAFGLGVESFYLGIGIAAIGLILSLFFVRGTMGHVALEAKHAIPHDSEIGFRKVFSLTSWTDRSLFSCSQAGLVNNLNDGIAWGLFPILFMTRGYSLEQIGMLAAAYPAVWGLGQLFTGLLSDRHGRKLFISLGMVLQGIAIAALIFAIDFGGALVTMIVLGTGTALVYPTLIAAVSDLAHPNWRATSVGVYRLWRDGGYVIGAIIVGVITDIYGMQWALAVVAALTTVSGLIVQVWMKESLPR